MILTGLTLGGYVATTWRQDEAPVARAQPTRTLTGAAHTVFPGDLLIYELESTLLVDEITATPQRVDAH
jgi:hypothetical protein